MNHEDLEVGKTYYASMLKWSGMPSVRRLIYKRDISENDSPLDRFVFFCPIIKQEEKYDEWEVKDNFYCRELDALTEHQRDLMRSLITCHSRIREIQKELMQRVGDMEKENESI